MMRTILDISIGNNAFFRGMKILEKKDGYYKLYKDTTCNYTEEGYIPSSVVWKMVSDIKAGNLPAFMFGIRLSDVYQDRNGALCADVWYH